MSERNSRRSIPSIPLTISPGETGAGCSICLRLKASKRRVSSAARSPASRTSWMESRSGSIAPSLLSITSQWPLITVSRLLKSCATPPARRPIDSSRFACNNSPSSRSVSRSASSRSVISWRSCWLAALSSVVRSRTSSSSPARAAALCRSRSFHAAHAAPQASAASKAMSHHD